MEVCRPLREYAWFIEEIRKNQKEHEIKEAVNRSIASMPDDFDIKDFLLENRKEVEGMLDTEYNEEEVWSAFQRDVDEEKKRADEQTKRANAAEAELGKLTAKMDEMAGQLQEALAEIARLKAAK